MLFRPQPSAARVPPTGGCWCIPLPCRWESSGYFKPDESAQGEPYVISMPPPNVTGKLHMGHAMFATLQVRAGAPPTQRARRAPATRATRRALGPTP